MDRNDVPQQEGAREELTWAMVDALEEVLDHWEQTHSPLDEAGLQKYMLARRGLNHLRAELSEPSA